MFKATIIAQDHTPLKYSAHDIITIYHGDWTIRHGQFVAGQFVAKYDNNVTGDL